jgi:hypothetical protein
MTSEYADRLARLQIPQANRLISRTGDYTSLISIQCDAQNGAGVAFKDSQEFSICNIPNS